MSKTTSFEMEVVSPKGQKFVFEAMGYFRENKNEFALADLYAPEVSQTYELEITNLEVINAQNQVLSNSVLHIHKGNDGQMYVCYPFKIKNLDDALEVFEWWVLITAYQMATGIEPNDLIDLVKYVARGTMTMKACIGTASSWIKNNLKWETTHVL